jgi:hypothetical protein
VVPRHHHLPNLGTQYSYFSGTKVPRCLQVPTGGYSLGALSLPRFLGKNSISRSSTEQSTQSIQSSELRPLPPSGHLLDHVLDHLHLPSPPSLLFETPLVTTRQLRTSLELWCPSCCISLP